LSAGVGSMEGLLKASAPVSATAPAPTVGSAASVPELPSSTGFDPIVAVEPSLLQILRPPRPIGRGITERLILGVATLAFCAAWIWVAPEPPPTTEVLRGTIRPKEIAPAEFTAAVAAPASSPIPPPWFSPQLLYVPTWMSAPSDIPRAGVPLPIARPARQ
jgi:hypothetical protein